MNNLLNLLSQVFTPAMPPPKPVMPTFVPAHVAITPPPVQPVLPPSPVPGCDAKTWADYEALLVKREGESYVVYYDSLGKPTAGIGHLLLPSDGLHVGDHVPDATVRRWFTHDGATAMDAAVSQARQAGIKHQPFLPYLASVCYQLGAGWTTKFSITWRMICAGDYDAAANNLNKSVWIKQTPVRCADFQFALRALPPKGDN